MSRITRAEVERMAGLARLSLTSDEVDGLTADLDTILGYVESLQAVATSGVGGGPADAGPTRLREDRSEPGLAPADALRNAPAAAGTTFVVPKVIEGGEG